jgi:hypothetical protein
MEKDKAERGLPLILAFPAIIVTCLTWTGFLRKIHALEFLELFWTKLPTLWEHMPRGQRLKCILGLVWILAGRHCVTSYTSIDE